MNARPHCAQPSACHSKSLKHCLSCARRIDWANPDIRARKLADMAVMFTPASREVASASKRRRTARKAVKAAGLPLLRRIVDRAQELRGLGQPPELVVLHLLEEARR